MNIYEEVKPTQKKAMADKPRHDNSQFKAHFVSHCAEVFNRYSDFLYILLCVILEHLPYVISMVLNYYTRLFYAMVNRDL